MMAAMFEEKDEAPTSPDSGTAAVPAKEEDTLVVPVPVGLREIPLTPEAAEEMRCRLDDPNQPTHTGKEMPTADASTLLIRIHPCLSVLLVA